MGVIMKDYIEFPAIVKEIDEIDSHNLKRFFRECAISGNKISLSHLRDLYRRDKDYFMEVVDELFLRGFVFHTEKPNNILPHRTIDCSSYFQVEEDETRFKQINQNRLGLSGFMKRFYVESDLFFNMIPLDGFRTINAQMDLQEIEDEFRRAGFTIIHEKQQPNQTEEAYVETEVIETSNSNSTELFGQITVELAFVENKFNTFRTFCAANQIEFLSEITDQTIYRYSLARSVGAGRVKQVEQHLEEIRNLSDDQLVKCFTQEDTEFADLPKLENKYAGEKQIIHLLHENKYTKFREYCSKKGISTVGEILPVHIDEFSKTPQVGKKKVTDVIDALSEYIEEANLKNFLVFESGEIYEFIKDTNVNMLFKVYDIKSENVPALIIEDIQGKSIKDLDEMIDERALITLSNQLQAQKNPISIVNQLESVLEERELEILKYRFNEGLTLEATAQHFDITRERVRQLERKAKGKITSYLESNHFGSIVNVLSPTDNFISRKALGELIGKEFSFVLEILKGSDSFFLYNELLDVYYFDNENSEIFSEVEELLSELPDVFYIHEYESALEESLENANIEEPTLNLIDRLLQNNGFTKYGEFYSRTVLRIHDLLSQIFKHLRTPLRLDEQGLEVLQKIAKRHFSFDLEGSVRSVDARLRDAENVLLVDRATFQWFDSESFDESIIQKVNTYLQEKLETSNVVNVEEVYLKFEDELKQQGIHHKLHLYSLIRYYLDEEYDIGKGNTLNIFNKDGEKLTIEEIMIKKIKELGGICTKDQLMEQLHWKLYKVDLAISSSYQLLPWGPNQVTYFDHLQLSEKEKNELTQLAQRSLQDGYTTTARIYKELMFNPILAPLIHEKEIDEQGKLAAIIKILISGLKGHINFLYLEDSPCKSFEEVLLHTFDEVTTRSEIREFALEFGYKDMMISHLIGKLIERSSFIEVDIDELYPAEKFEVSDEAVRALLQFAEENMQGKEYISISNLKGYRRKLPPLDDFRWNAHIIKSILVQHGYRQISKKFNDYRYDKVIVVREESKIQSFEELIYHILQEEYKGNMHEIPIYDFLASKGILREQEHDSKKVLPYEIKNINNLIAIDDLGYVTLKGDVHVFSKS